MNTAQTQASDIRNIQQKESHLSNQQKERESIHIAFSGPVLSEEWRDSSTCHSELQWSACMETHAGVCQCQFQSLRQCSFANKTRSMCFKKMFVERDSLAQLIHKVKFFFVCLIFDTLIGVDPTVCLPIGASILSIQTLFTKLALFLSLCQLLYSFPPYIGPRCYELSQPINDCQRVTWPSAPLVAEQSRKTTFSAPDLLRWRIAPAAVQFKVEWSIASIILCQLFLKKCYENKLQEFNSSCAASHSTYAHYFLQGDVHPVCSQNK